MKTDYPHGEMGLESCVYYSARRYVISRLSSSFKELSIQMTASLCFFVGNRTTWPRANCQRLRDFSKPPKLLLLYSRKKPAAGRTSNAAPDTQLFLHLHLVSCVTRFCCSWVFRRSRLRSRFRPRDMGRRHGIRDDNRSAFRNPRPSATSTSFVVTQTGLQTPMRRVSCARSDLSTS